MFTDEARTAFERIKLATTVPSDSLVLDEKYPILLENYRIWLRELARVRSENANPEWNSEIWRADLQWEISAASNEAREQLITVERQLIARQEKWAFYLHGHIRYGGAIEDIGEKGRWLCFHMISTTLLRGEEGMLVKKVYALNTEEIWLEVGEGFNWCFSHEGKPADSAICRKRNDAQIDRLRLLLMELTDESDAEEVLYLEQVACYFMRWYRVFGYNHEWLEDWIDTNYENGDGKQSDAVPDQQKESRLMTQMSAIRVHEYLRLRPKASQEDIKGMLLWFGDSPDIIKAVRDLADYHPGRGKGSTRLFAECLEAKLPLLEQEISSVFLDLVAKERARIQKYIDHEDRNKRGD